MTGPTVLCVDDERPVLDSLRRDLGRRGFQVLMAQSAAAAREVLAAETVDAAVVDLRLPGEDGIDLLAEMAERVPGAVRVLLTAAGDYQTSQRAINEGRVFAYLEKPWEGEALARTLRAGLEVKDSAVARDSLTAPEATGNDTPLSADTWQALRALEAMEPSHKAGHGHRVAELIGGFCAHIGISESRAREAQAAALVHDLGEALMSDVARNTPERRLTGEPLREFQRHPETGAAILRAIDGLQTAADIVAAHHERHDGQGFPRGLSGDGIPAAVRIFAVADAYDELQLGCYGRRRLSPREAREELERYAGTRFDPRAVRAFVRWVSQAEAADDGGEGVPLSDLKPGMVLSEDLTTPDGLLLVPAGHRLTEALLSRIAALSANMPDLRARIRQ